MQLTDIVLTFILCLMVSVYLGTGIAAHVERARSERARRRVSEMFLQKVRDAESFTEIVRSNGLEDF